MYLDGLKGWDFSPLEPYELDRGWQSIWSGYYLQPSIQSEMVYDRVRVDTYLKAIRKVVRPGDVVADMGTGTGLLAFLCLLAGAKHVYAVESSDIIHVAKEIAKINGVLGKMTFCQEDCLTANLGGKVDVIVSEPIGHLAFEEYMCHLLLLFKRRHLKPGGAIMPRKIALWSAPILEKHIYPRYIDGWKAPVYGIDFSPMRMHALDHCYPCDILPEDLLSAPKKLFELDYVNETLPSSYVEKDFVFRQDGQVNALGLWFKSELAPDVVLSTGPGISTHWGQAFAPLVESIEVKKNQSVRFGFEMLWHDDRGEGFEFHVKRL